MSGLRRKKKSLKEKQSTQLKDPSITLKALINKARGYLAALESKPDNIQEDVGEMLRFRRFKDIDN